MILFNAGASSDPRNKAANNDGSFEKTDPPYFTCYLFVVMFKKCRHENVEHAKCKIHICIMQGIYRRGAKPEQFYDEYSVFVTSRCYADNKVDCITLPFIM